MPTYDFHCNKCGGFFERRVSFSEAQDGAEHDGCNYLAVRCFSPNPNVFIPARFGLSRTWHMSDTGPSEHGMVSNGSQVHAPKRESFTETFDKSWKKAGGSL